jgi:hypothetical protein
MARQSRTQKETVRRVMHEFKEGELETRGRKVKNPKQAIAIALNEAGASRRQGKAMTRAELYEEAKRFDIPGRSRMAKAELEKAVQRARH